MSYSVTFNSISCQGSASFFSGFAVNVHDSQAYRNMDMTREHVSVTFHPRDMLLSVHIGFKFVRAAMACAVLETAYDLNIWKYT